MHGTVVGVLRGGPSSEHEISLKSGHTFLSHLPKERFTVRDIYIDKAGVWHDRGIPSSPGRILPMVDVAIIALHGQYGDGEAQRLLERFGIPYTGADAHHAFMAGHKLIAKERVKEAGLLTPEYVFAERAEDAAQLAHDAVRTFNQPVVVKAVDLGASHGVTMVGGFQPVKEAIERFFSMGARGVMVEERIRGIEATVGVVEGLRGEVLYALPPVEIVPPAGHDFFSTEAKYSGKSLEIVPGRFTRKVTDALLHAARVAHDVLGQRHYSRSDFMVSPKGIYFLELNTASAVGMTGESLLPKALDAVGVKLGEFAEHVVDLARKA